MVKNSPKIIKLDKVWLDKFSLEKILPIKLETKPSPLHLLVGEDFSIRIEEKKIESTTITLLARKIMQITDFVSSEKQKIFEGIKLNDKFMKDAINKDFAIDKQTSGELDDQLIVLKRRASEIERIQKNLGLSLLRLSRPYYCEKCHCIRQWGSSLQPIRGVEEKPTCFSCKQPLEKKKRIMWIPEKISELLRGLWLEFYVGNILEKEGWKVWPSVYAFGTSGAKFEIDVLALKNGHILLAECKTGSVGLRDVTAFVSKVYDIKCKHALFVTIEPVEENMLKVMTGNPAFTVINGCNSDLDIANKVHEIKT